MTSSYSSQADIESHNGTDPQLSLVRLLRQQRLRRNKFVSYLSFLFITLVMTASNHHQVKQLSAILSKSSTSLDDAQLVNETASALPLAASEQSGGALSPPSNPDTTSIRTTKRRPNILLFGDSLTQRGFGENGFVGWASLLASAYTRRADIINRGFGGYNSNHALDVWPNIEPILEETPLLFVTIFFGANDAALPGESQHVSIDDYYHNLLEITVKVRQRLQQQQPLPEGVILPTIFLFTPPPVDEVAYANFINKTESTRLNQITQRYGDAVKQVVQDCNAQNSTHDKTTTTAPVCALVDTWSLLEGNNATVYPKYLLDGLHLNELGNRKIYQGLMDIIDSQFPLLAPKTHDHPEGISFDEKAWHEYDFISASRLNATAEA